MTNLASAFSIAKECLIRYCPNWMQPFEKRYSQQPATECILDLPHAHHQRNQPDRSAAPFTDDRIDTQNDGTTYSRPIINGRVAGRTQCAQPVL